MSRVVITPGDGLTGFQGRAGLRLSQHIGGEVVLRGADARNDSIVHLGGKKGKPLSGIAPNCPVLRKMVKVRCDQ